MIPDVTAITPQTAIVANMDSHEAVIDRIIGPNPFFIEAAKVDAIKQKLGWDHEKILRHLVNVAKPLARPNISKYYVGGAVLGESGAIYLGVNLEFSGVHLNQSVHAEQFLVALARSFGEKGLTMLAVSAAPCGHCRQFMNEMEGAPSLKIYYQKPQEGEVSATLGQLLPDAFGPEDLGMKRGLLGATFPIDCGHENKLVAEAMRAAYNSYSPYSKVYSGVAIKTKDNLIFRGSYLENVGFNPSLSPLQVALISLVAHGVPYDHISEVVLVEDKPMHYKGAESLLANIAPKAHLKAFTLGKSQK